MADLTINPDLPDSSAEPVQAAPMRTVTIQGQTYTVPEDVAAAIEEREREFQRKLSEQAKELQERWVHKPAQEPPAHPDVIEGLDTLLFENPKEALKRFKEAVVKEVTSLYQADQGQRQFWAEFYQEYPELRKHQTLVSAVLNQHFAEWAALPIPTARQRLAEEVKRELVEIAKTFSPSSSARTYTEEQRIERPRPVASEAPAPPKSLSQLLRERRARHRPAIPTV